MNKYTEAINSSDLVLVEFFATWCPHCQRMMPVVAEVRDELSGVAEVYQFDIDASQRAAEDAGVDGVPTFILYKDGEEMWRQSGEMDREDLVNVVRNFA